MMSANGFRIGEKSPESDLPSVRRKPHGTLTKAEGGLKGSFKLRLAAARFRLGESATSRAEN
jgi:hypothetical protein